MDQKVVFSGRVREGMSVEQVRANFAQVFKVSDPAVLDRMFSGVPVVLRKNLDAEKAAQVVRVLFKAGALCEVEPAAPAPSAPAAVLSTGAFRAADLSATLPKQAPAPATAPPQPDLAATLPGASAGPILSLMRDRPAMDPPPAAVAAAPAPAATHPDVSGLSLKAEPEPEAAAAPGAQATHRLFPERIQSARKPAAAAEPQPQAEEEEGTHGYAVAPEDPLLEPWQPGSALPQAARGLAWGGFFAPLIWGAFNGMALSWLPLIGVRVLRGIVPAWLWLLLYLGFGAFFLFKGRELAWERKNWRNGHHFLKVQRYWNFGGAVLFLLFMWGMGSLIIEERLAERYATAFEALVAAEQQADPVRRTAMVAQARKNLLALVEDPLERAELQKEFEDADAAAGADPAGAETARRP